MNSPMKARVFSRNQTMGGSTGPCQPPKKSVTTIMEISVMPTYSPM
jgi:hypothetical protein